MGETSLKIIASCRGSQKQVDFGIPKIIATFIWVQLISIIMIAFFLPERIFLRPVAKLFGVRYQKSYEWLYGSLMKLALWGPKAIYGMKVDFDSDALPKSDIPLILPNHPHSLYTGSLAAYLVNWLNLVQKGRVVCINRIALYPFFGNMLWATRHLFVKNGEVNLSEAGPSNSEAQPILIYCDGYDANITKFRQYSDDFCREQDIPPFHWVLHPKTRGFHKLMTRYRTRFTHVYEVTYIFPDGPLNRFWNAIFHPPTKFVFEIKRTPIEDLPHGKEELKNWIVNSFREKDAILKSYYGPYQQEDEKLEKRSNS